MIREATLDDLDELIRMGRLFCEQADLPFDEASIAPLVQNMTESDNMMLLIGDGALVGALAYPMFTDNSVIAVEELFWWVDEDKRSSGIGKELIKAVELWAKSIGASRTLLSGLASSPKHVDSFYRKNGYQLLEIKYWKDL